VVETDKLMNQLE